MLGYGQPGNKAFFKTCSGEKSDATVPKGVIALTCHGPLAHPYHPLLRLFQTCCHTEKNPLTASFQAGQTHNLSLPNDHIAF